MTLVGTIWRRALYTPMALGTADKYRLAIGEMMKPFEQMNPTQRDCLHRLTKGARIDDLGEQPTEQLHPGSQIGCVDPSGLPALRNSSAIGS